jgi:K+-sensing histidine kinase KdpD
MSEAASPVNNSSELQVPMDRIVQFVRQLSHDLRNHLNAAELQAAFLKEIATDAELRDEVQRLRTMISEVGTSLQQVTTSLAPIKLTTMPYAASAFLEDLRAKVEQQFGASAAAFTWEVAATDAMLEIDPQLLQQALLELLGNALQHASASSSTAVGAEVRGGELTLTVREPKAAFDGSTADWGREPFKTAKHGHYSLGLHRARNIIEAHGGTLTAEHDGAASVLVTTVSLPISDARA